MLNPQREQKLKSVFRTNLVLGLKAEISKDVFNSFFVATFVDDNLVADGLHGLCACTLTHFVKDELCRRFRAFEHGNFDEFVRGKGVEDVIDLIVPYAVFADLKDWIQVLRKTFKSFPFTACQHVFLFNTNI